MDSIAFFRHAFLRHDPLRHAQMLPPDRPQKYMDHAYPITDKQIAAHLRGTCTFAAPAAHAGMGCVIAFDVDGGGLAAIQALLAAAADYGCFAFGQYCPRDGWADVDQRGYGWLVFDGLTHILRLEALGKQIRHAAGYTKNTVELRTHHGDTRLPLGKHTHTGQFGQLVFQDGTIMDIDAAPRKALRELIARYRENSVDILPEAPTTHERTAPRPSLSFGSDDIIRIYNERTCIRGLVLNYGGKRAGYTSYHCCCGQHSNSDGKASLGIVRSTNPKYGPWMVKGFAETCRFYRATDAFGVYCAMEGLTPKDAVKRIAASMGLTNASGREPHPQHPAPPTVEAVDSDGPRRPHTRPFAPAPTPAEVASKIREALWLRLSLDGDRTESERALMRYLLTEAAADETIWCQRSKEQIAAAIGYGTRTIQVARRKLVAAGYLNVQESGNQWGGDESNWYRLGGGESAGACDSPPIKSVLNDHGIPDSKQVDSESPLRLGRGAIQDYSRTVPHQLPNGDSVHLSMIAGAPPLAAKLPSRSHRVGDVEIVESVEKPRRTRSQRTQKAVDTVPAIAPAVKTRIMAILQANDHDRSLRWLTQLQREGLLEAAQRVLATEARRHFALGQRTRGKKRQWQRTTIMERLAEPCSEPLQGRSHRSTPTETPQTQRLAELGVFPTNIERFAALPLATIDQAIRLARSIDGDVAKLTVAFLKRHLHEGWTIPAPTSHDDGMLDMTKYTDGGKYAGFFTHISGDDDQSPHHARTV